jgi:hypothetical protein
MGPGGWPKPPPMGVVLATPLSTPMGTRGWPKPPQTTIGGGFDHPLNSRGVAEPKGVAFKKFIFLKKNKIFN